MENPKVLMITNEEDALGAKYEKRFPELTVKGIKIISPEEQHNKFKEIVFKGGSPELGSVFILHPFNKNTYVNLQVANEIIANDKKNFFFGMCQYLGISEIQEELEMSNSVQKLQRGTLGGSKAGVSASAEMSFQNENSQMSQRKTRMTFKNSGNVDFEKACKFAKQHNLLEDNEISRVLDACNPERKNTLQEYEVNLVLNNEVNNLLEVAANLTLLKGALEISGKYERKFRERHETKKTLYLKFN